MPNVNGFTHEDDVVLIALIRQNRELYDIKHKMHKDIAFKDRIWNEISTEIGKSVYQCKRRWKNIKAFYLKSKSNMETGSSVNNNWSLSTYVSFLDENLYGQNIQNSGVQLELGEQNIFDKFLHDDGLELPSSSSSAGNSSQSKENKIAVILAEGLKERNEILYNSLQKQIEILDNTSFTVTIQYEQNATSNVQSEESKNEHGEHVADENAQDEEFTLPQQLSPDTVTFYLAEKLAQSKERNTILHNLQKQIEILNNKSEATKSLDLFFKSVLLDVQDFCPRAIDDIKPRILKCVSEVREMYHNSNVSSDNVSCSNGEKCTHLDEGSTILLNLQKQIEMLNSQSGITKTMDLFFKSVSVDIEDFCIRAIDDVKLKILECVSEVKEMYSSPAVSSVTSSINGNTTPNYAPPHTPPINLNNITESPPQGFITYLNVPLYCNDPSNYVHSYY